jgi:hypothetical protein
MQIRLQRLQTVQKRSRNENTEGRIEHIHKLRNLGRMNTREIEGEGVEEE